MAKFQQKGKGGSSKIEKKKTSGQSKQSKQKHTGNSQQKPGGKRAKILQKKAKFGSKKSQDSPRPKTQKKEEPSENEIKSVGVKRRFPPPTPNKDGNSDAKKGKTDGVEDPMKKGKTNHEDGVQDPTRKGKPDRGDGVKDLMLIYEQLRRKNTSKDDKYKLIEEVLLYSRDKKDQVMFKHGTVRVLEHCVKYGDVAQRESLFELFKDNTVQLTTQDYSKFLVKKFMEYGTKQQRAKIITAFYGKVRYLIKQKTAADILEELFSKYANSVQRVALTEEFYGPEFAVFKVATGQSFEYMIENEPEKKQVVLDFMKAQFITLSQKSLILHSISHKALLDFFKYANHEQKTEVHEVLKEQVHHILHTKEGAKVAMNCLWLGTKKDRKNILKSFKTFVVKICKEEFGHLVMLALFDVVDDTVLVKKALFSEILSNVEDLIKDQYGRKVILYLLKPRAPSYFLPDIIKILEQGDNNVYSKKPREVRQDELRACVLPDLLKVMVPHLGEIMKNKRVAIVLLAALECAADSPELTSVFEKIAGIISEPLKKKENEDENNSEDIDNNKTDAADAANTADVDHPICDACGHWVIKSIIQQDKTRKEKNTETTTFSQILCNTISPGRFAEWATFNRGAFVLMALIKSGIDDVKTMVVENVNLSSRDDDDDGDGPGIKLLRTLLTE